VPVQTGLGDDYSNRIRHAGQYRPGFPTRGR
jgi:hypothetical protein